MRAQIRGYLREQRRGLLTSALRFIAVYPEPGDAEILLNIYDNQLSLRNLSLTVLECLGTSALEPLLNHISAGGDDIALLTLENRYEILACCLDSPVKTYRDRDRVIA